MKKLKNMLVFFVAKDSLRERIGVFTYAVSMKARNIIKNVNIVENLLANFQT